jgi:Ribbon-helix-helix protein, copG family.
MVKEIEVKLSDELYNLLEEYAKKKNTTKSEIIRNAIAYYLGISEVIDKPIRESKAIVTTALFSSKCRKCGKDINQGDPIGLIKIYYEGEDKPRTFAYCLDCYYSLTDKTIVQLEVKRVKLQRTVTALRREISKLADIYDSLEKEINLINRVVSLLES